MSYDVRILMREQVTGRFVVIAEPERHSPTYNLRDVFKKAMGMDWEQGVEYPCAEMLPAIKRGIDELTYNRGAYERYAPPNGWGTLKGALECLEECRDMILNLTEGDESGGTMMFTEPWPIECLWFRW